MADKEYIKLGFGKFRRANLMDQYRSSIWLGADHILLVESFGGYFEEYKRFYFHDIQAFLITPTRRRMIIAITLFPFLGICLYLTFTLTGGFSIFWGICSVILLFLFIINLAKGTGAQTYIKTAVQLERLPSLNRIPKAHKYLRKIREQIDQAQGLLTPELARQLLADGQLLQSPSQEPVAGGHKQVEFKEQGNAP